MESDFLFAMPSIWSGVARLVDLGAQFDSYNECETGEEADARALYSDWRMVGQDLQRAMEIFYVESDLGPKQLLLGFDEFNTEVEQHVAQER